MAFVSGLFIVAILFNHTGSQTILSTQLTDGINLVEHSSSQGDGDNTIATASTVVTFTDHLNEVNESEYNSSFLTDVQSDWNNGNISEEEIQIDKEIMVSFPPSPTLVESSNPSLDKSEANLTFIGDTLEIDDNNTVILDESMSSTQMLELDTDEIDLSERGEYIMPEIPNDTFSSEQWITKNSSLESRDYTTASSKEQEELLLLKSNCTIVANENIILNEHFANVDCTIYLRMNFSSENETRDALLNILQKLTVKPNEFQVVEIYNQDEEDASGHNEQSKQHSFVFDPETFAYLAVALAFAFLLLLAVIVFGFRCFKKRRPSLEVSRFDVRLSSYTLTKIPRASLSSLDCLHETDCLDDKPESSTAQNKDYESCESGLDIIPCDTYSSNREMKTFGVPRSIDSRNADSMSDMYPQHNPIAYENQTFQRYF